MNDVRLIDADALKIENVDLEHGCTVVDYALAVIKSVSIAPTIDAVPVVRCKDCQSFQDDEIAAPCTGTCWHCEMVRAFDDFCSYGEPKDGDA